MEFTRNSMGWRYTVWIRERWSWPCYFYCDADFYHTFVPCYQHNSMPFMSDELDVLLEKLISSSGTRSLQTKIFLAHQLNFLVTFVLKKIDILLRHQEFYCWYRSLWWLLESWNRTTYNGSPWWKWVSYSKPRNNLWPRNSDWNTLSHNF